MHISELGYADYIHYTNSFVEVRRPFRCQYVYNELTMLQAQCGYGTLPVTNPQRAAVKVSSRPDNYYLTIL